MKYTKRIPLTLMVVLLLAACSDDETTDGFKSVGTITGPDFRFCGCCGGWFINIGTSTYRFHRLPENSNIDLEAEEFPVPVNVDWRPDENACLDDEIIVGRIEKTVSSAASRAGPSRPVSLSP